MPCRSELNEIFYRIESIDPKGAKDLLPLVYNELRQLAQFKFANEKPGQTLQPTALVHEAYRRVVGDRNQLPWENLAHFFRAEAEAMRRILVDQARRKSSTKRGGDLKRVDLEVEIVVPAHSGVSPEELLALDEALRAQSRNPTSRSETGQHHARQVR